MAVSKLKAKFHYDDALDAFGVHGVGSTIGMALTGVFASTVVNPAISTTFKVGGNTVSLAGGAGQLMNQLTAVAFTWVLAGVATFLILKLVDAVIGLRVTEEDELRGLDVSQHGEEAYND